MGQPGHGTMMEPDPLAENHAPGGPETAARPWGLIGHSTRSTGKPCTGGRTRRKYAACKGNSCRTRRAGTTRANLTAGNKSSSKTQQRPSLSESEPMPERRISAGMLARPEPGCSQWSGWNHGGGLSGKPGFQSPGLGEETGKRQLSRQIDSAVLHSQGQREGKAIGPTGTGRQTRTTGLRQTAERHLRGRFPGVQLRLSVWAWCEGSGLRPDLQPYVQDKTLNAQMNSWVFSVTFRTALRRKSSP